MDSDMERKRNSESARKHRRNTSHGLPPTPARALSQRWEQLPRAPPARPATSQANYDPTPPDYEKDAVPSTNKTEARSKRQSRSRPVIIEKQLSHEDLRKSSARLDHKPRDKQEAENRDLHYATLPRRRREKTEPHQPLPLQTSYISHEPLPSRPATATNHVRKDQSLFDGRDRSRRSSAGPNSSILDMDGDDAPAHYSHGRSRKMLHLMSITRGSARGRLYIRQDSQGVWSLEQCFINPHSGSLMCETTSRGKSDEVLVRNLRGCRVQTVLDPQFSSTILVLRPLESADMIELRSEDPTQADRWFAAFLCWQPVHPMKTLINQEEQSILPASALNMANGQTTYETRGRKDGAMVKVSKVLYLESSEPYRSQYPATSSKTDCLNGSSNEYGLPWTHVSCTLRDNGELRLYTIVGVSALATIRLPDLSRSCVQRLNSTALGLDYCIAISPQQSRSGGSKPLYLAFEARVLFEVWFVLLRAFTAPEIHGSGWVRPTNLLSSASLMPGFLPESSPGLFRLERSLHVQIAEAKLKATSGTVDGSPDSGKSMNRWPLKGSTSRQYIRLLLDGQVKARTSVKPSSSDIFWYETLDVIDMPPNISHAVIQLMNVGSGSSAALPQPSEWDYELDDKKKRSKITDPQQETLMAEAVVDLSTMASGKEIEQRLPLLDSEGIAVGRVQIKTRLDNAVLLMDREYRFISGLLHQDSGTITHRIAAKIPMELPRLAECLLDIYQSSGRASDWLKTLAEGEIDGVHRSSPVPRFNARLESDASEAGGARADLVRELNNAAAAEANLLFRGNTLLSKALDCYMKRLGKDYLDATIGHKIRMIAQVNPDCEVDPTRLRSGTNLQQNWNRLLVLTEELWKSIYESALRCPPELRGVFRHIAACVDDHYGERLRSVRYSAVSGFLFLRFFCPAILNPRLFGLLSENPKTDAQRTFTLITKSLQALANQVFISVKEPWMKPMDKFIGEHKQQLRAFIDTVCTIGPRQETTPLSPSYSTPLALYTRLPPTSREGFPSLPYLIDHTHAFAVLVNLWLDNFPLAKATPETLEPDLLQFHQFCLALRKQSQNCLAQLAKRNNRESNLTEKWSSIAKEMDAKPADFWVDNRDGYSRSRAQVRSGIFTSQTDGRVTPARPLISGGKSSDDASNSPQSALANLVSSSLRFESTASSEVEQQQQRPPTSTSSRAQKSEGSSTMFGLFGRRKKR